MYGYNPKVSYKPNEGRYLQLMSAKDLYIQNITVYNMIIIAIIFKLIFQMFLRVIHLKQ